MKQIFNIPRPVEDAEDFDSIFQRPIEDHIPPKLGNGPGPYSGEGGMIGFALAAQIGHGGEIIQGFVQR